MSVINKLSIFLQTHRNTHTDSMHLNEMQWQQQQQQTIILTSIVALFKRTVCPVRACSTALKLFPFISRALFHICAITVLFSTVCSLIFMTIFSLYFQPLLLFHSVLVSLGYSLLPFVLCCFGNGFIY